MAKIQNIFAKEILDSRGVPTLEVTVVLNDNTQEIASAPSGTSTGIHEAQELRDGDQNRYHGMGVLKAVKVVNEAISPKLRGLEANKQKQIDERLVELDGTKQRQKLGVNSIVGVSAAVAKAAARSGGFELYEYINLLAGRPKMAIPIPLANLVNGGKHAQGGPQFQEFQLIPVRFSRFSQMLADLQKVFAKLEQDTEQRGLKLGYGLEGGVVPRLTETADILTLMSEALTGAGFSKDQFNFGIDAAASNVFVNNRYDLDGKEFSQDKLIDYLDELTSRYPITLLEDPMAQDDWFGWEKISQRLPKLILVGDDLFVSQQGRLQEGIKRHAANAIIIKPNQVGTISETLETVALARQSGYKLIASHRSGETRDSFIADFSVGIAAWGIKAGAFNQGERMSKYKRLVAIENKLKG